MRIEAPGLVLVPYGVEKWTFEAIRVVPPHGSGLALETGFSALLIDRRSGEPLRFNTSDYDLSAAPGGIDEDDPFIAIREHTKRLGDPWNRFVTAFVDGYFATVERLIAESGAAVPEEAGLAGSIYEPRDWIYSAPRPLPRAHLHAPATSGSATESSYIVVDLAFWTGRRFVAVDGAIAQMLPKRARERRQRLAGAGIDLVTELPSGAEAWERFVARVSERDSPCFWRSQRLPMGPFRSKALDLLDAVAPDV